MSYFSTPHMLQDQLCWQCLTQLGQSCRPQIVPKVGWNGDDAFMLWKVCVVLSFEASACLLSSEGQSSKSLHFGDVETTSQHCRRVSSASHSVLVESVLFRGNVIGCHGVIAVDWDPNRNKTKESRQVREMIHCKLTNDSCLKIVWGIFVGGALCGGALVAVPLWRCLCGGWRWLK